jgi:hypothetical protein
MICFPKVLGSTWLNCAMLMQEKISLLINNYFQKMHKICIVISLLGSYKTQNLLSNNLLIYMHKMSLILLVEDQLQNASSFFLWFIRNIKI